MSAKAVCRAAFAVALALAVAGCATTSTFETGMRNPSFAIVGSGVKFEGRYIMPKEAPKILEAHKIPHDAVIYVRVDDMARDLAPAPGGGPPPPGAAMRFNEGKANIKTGSQRIKEANVFMAILNRAGYRKAVLVSQEKSSAWSVK